MKINEFIKNQDYAQLNVKRYLPISTKKALANVIIEKIITIENNMVFYSSVDKEIFFDLSCIIMYTDLELSDNDYTDYDLLQSYDCLNKIIDLFRNEYDICKHIYNLELQDLLRQNNELEVVVANNLKTFNTTLQSTLSHVNGVLDRTDGNKVVESLGKGFDKIGDLLMKVETLFLKGKF